MVLTRVRRTGAGPEGLLRCGAVLGSAFDLGVAADLLDLPAEQAAEAADRALRAGLITPAGEQLAFANDLIREILYRDTPKAILVAPHRRAAALLAGNPQALSTYGSAASDWTRPIEAGPPTSGCAR